MRSALWEDPEPTTPEGAHLVQLHRDGRLSTSPSGIRDFGQRVCQVEREAAAAGLPSNVVDLATANLIHRLDATAEQAGGEAEGERVTGALLLRCLEANGIRVSLAGDAS